MSTKKTWLVLLLFFCSGATALVYEVVWSKYLSQMFGSTIYAQTVVLAVFMGGLALGNRIFGGRADALARPVRAYGLVEMVIGLYAFFFPQLFSVADRIFVSVGQSMLENTIALLAIKGVLSVALLIIPTILMGGTLPLLAAYLQRTSLDSGRKSARFYSINSLGAVTGCAVAGFYLIQSWGMVAALQVSAMVNLVIAGAAILLSREIESDSPAPAAKPSEAATETSGVAVRWAGVLVGITGGISMGLEVLASRSMALLFGSSLQAFAIVLISFILGIGLGSAIVASPRFRAWNPTKVITILLVAAAVWIGLLVFRIESWMDVYRVLRTGIARSMTGYIFHQFLAVSIAMFVLGIPAAMIGAVLPLLIRSLSEQGAKLGQQVGRLLTANTIGAVAGVLLTGFVIMPVFGLRNAFLVLALGLAGAAAFAAWRQQLKNMLTVSGGASLLLVMFIVGGSDEWRHVMSSGAFRAREVEMDKDAMALRKKHIKIHFYEDAADATVSVEKGDGVGADADVGLRLNGKTDASSRGDLCTQLLVGHIPMLARPDAKDVFILGLGSGITGGAILGHEVERLTIAENCEPVIRAARYFSPWNRGVLTNAKTRIVCEDARTVLKLSPQKYDIIITQPSNPWMAGVGSVFSKEYYELAAQRLKEGGIVAQWFHVYDMHDGIVDLVLRTFGSVFPHMEIWDSASGDIILLGAKQAWASDVSVYRKLFERAAPRADFERVGIKSPEALWARQLASQRTAFAIAGPGAIQSDLFPILEYEAPRAFFIGSKAKNLVKFDERTWQAKLSPPEKQRALAGLSTEDLKPVFTQFSTINDELRSHLAWRFHGGLGSAPEYRHYWPCVFKTETKHTVYQDVPADAAEDVKRLLKAVRVIEENGEKIGAAVDDVLALLRSFGANSQWSPAHYGAIAARASIALGDINKAGEIVNSALRHEPGHADLAYLQRVIERSGSVVVAAKR